MRHPIERLRDVLGASGARLLLASQAAADLLEPVLQGLDAPPLTLVAESLWLAGEPAALPPSSAPGDLAYAIFTSGSTGKPKAALIEQRGMLNNMLAKVPLLGLCESDRLAQTASPAFDISVWQFLAAPLVGATVHILPDEIAHDPLRLCEAVARQRITLLEIVPSFMRSLLELGPVHSLESLRWMLPTGEALPLKLAQDWFEHFAHTPLMNVYGPAECADDVAYHPITQRPADRSSIPIGRPAPNTQLFILDPRLQPVPIGIAGEICVAGAGVGRGYLHDAQQTQAAFVDHPFAPGQRFYRSGDIGRYRADGVIEFLGRKDHQVKIRGHRIELGEIEARLHRLPALAQAVVVAWPDERGDSRLVAYWVARDGASADTSELRDALMQQLPHYMVPALFVQLDALPLNANGKIDRTALPAPQAPCNDSRHVSARNPTEELLAASWASILRRDRVGIHDNFFDLGGHSLLATQVISKIRSAFAIELPLRALFEAPTIAEFGSYIDGLRAQGLGIAAPHNIEPADRTGALALSFSQQRLWFLDQFEPGSALYNMPAPARVIGALNLAAFRRSLDEIVRRHEALRTVFPVVDGKPVQVVTPALHLPLAVIDLSHLPAAQRDPETLRLARDDAARPFDLEAGPLIRASLVRFSDAEHVLLLNMHHIVSDGWSVGLLVQELTALYGAFSRGLASPLADLSIQYADFAQWQQRWFQGDVLEQQLRYWKEHLDGAPTKLELPTDHLRPAVQTHPGASLIFELPKATSDGLQSLTRQANATLFMTLAAAFNVLLGRYSGQTDICIGTAIANRNRAEIEPLIGFFLNTLVLRTRLDGNPRFRELLQQVRETALNAYAHQDLPFEQLVDELKPQRELSHSPLFQVLFILQNAPMGPTEGSGLLLEPIYPENQVAKYDLALDMLELGDKLYGSLEYNTDLFERATIERMVEHFKTLLQAVAAAPDTPIDELPLLSAGERTLMLDTWNRPLDHGFSLDESYAALFAAQVERHPDRIAAVCGDVSLSYRELDTRARRLAHALRAAGARPDTLVALLAERGLPLLAMMIAVQQAGAAFFALDGGLAGILEKFSKK